MKKKNFKPREYEATKWEIEFEKLLNSNGFEVIGVCEYVTLTDYLIKKDGVEVTWRVHKDTFNVEEFFEIFVNYFNMWKQLLEKERGNKDE